MNSKGFLFLVLCVLLVYHVPCSFGQNLIQRIENRLDVLEESNRELKKEIKGLKSENAYLQEENKKMYELLRKIQLENILLMKQNNGNGRMEESSWNRTMNKQENTTRSTSLVDTRKHSVPRIISSPQPVAFHAYMHLFNANIPTHMTLIFDTVILNEGNGYTKHDGVFIAPVTGLYAFYWSIKVNAYSWASIEIIVNGNQLGFASADTQAVDVWGTGSDLVVTHANAGDHVALRTHEPVIGSIISNSRARSSFSGWLIHS